jgi:hypothetical protein
MSSLEAAASIITAAAAVTAVVGGYVQFVLKRSVLPSAEFDVQFTPYMRSAFQVVGELALVFKAHVSRLLEKLEYNNRIQIALLAHDADEAQVAAPQ